MMKQCTKCKEYKELCMFHINPSSKDGLYSRCRDCKNKKTRYHFNEIKDIVYNRYGGYECKCCGETEVSFLSIDHINDDGYKLRSGKNKHSGSELYRWIIKNNYPEGFQILCHNCNLGRHINNGTCPHVAEKGI